MNGPHWEQVTREDRTEYGSLVTLACPLLCRRRRRLRRSLRSLCPTFAGSHVPGALAMPSPTGKATQTSSCRAQACGGHQGSTATLQPVTQSHRGVTPAPEEDAILGEEEAPALREGALPGRAAHLPDELLLYWGGAVLFPQKRGSLHRRAGPSGSFPEKLPGKQARPYSPENLPPTQERPPSPRESQVPLSKRQPWPPGQSFKNIYTYFY